MSCMLIIDFSFFFSIIYGNTLLFAYSVINRPDELKFDFVCVYFPMLYCITILFSKPFILELYYLEYFCGIGMHLINTRLVIAGVREQCTIVIVIVIVMPKSKCMQSFCYYNLIVAEFSAESISDDVDVTYLTLSSSLILYCSNIPLTKIKKRILFSSVHHRV